MDHRENDLIAQAQKGDVAAFEALVRCYQDRLWRIAVQIVGDGDDAQDVCQECLIKVFRSLCTFRAGERFSVWLYRIAVNAAIDFRRRQRKRGQVALSEELPDRGGPSVELRILLEAVLEQLSPKQRSAFVLRDLQGFSLAEIAHILRCSKVTARVHLFRARKVIREKVGQES
ncbi:MAG: RNA polymerase sigma factor [Candidatus Latescibacteria bacterium]|nr:RNA polymerase sigma factor [Candidatus Latescibacterota bacterium]